MFSYADDILILSLTVGKVPELFNVIERELQTLDLTIQKSSCLRICPIGVTSINCSIITSVTGGDDYLGFCDKIFGVFLVKSRSFKICLNNAKRSFYRAAYAIFG